MRINYFIQAQTRYDYDDVTRRKHFSLKIIIIIIYSNAVGDGLRTTVEKKKKTVNGK